MPTDEGIFVEQIATGLFHLYSSLKGADIDVQRPQDTEFMRDVRRCLLAFYRADPRTGRIEWRAVPQEEQEQALQTIDGEVRAMLAKYEARLGVDSIYSESVQSSFRTLRGLVRTWPFKPKPKPTEATKAERMQEIQELLGEMRRLIDALGHAVEEK
jgi:hypothetical protein